MAGKAARALPSRLRSALFHNALRNSASPNSEMRRWRRIGKGFPLDSHYLKGFFKGGKGVGLSLYRLPAFCHADSLIPADRFLRKEKSSTLLAGYFLRRTGIPAQTGLDLPIGVCEWGTLYARGNPSTTAVPLVRRRSPLPYVPPERMTREASQLSALRDALCVVKSHSSS